jgi:hypothetical protein
LNNRSSLRIFDGFFIYGLLAYRFEVFSGFQAATTLVSTKILLVLTRVLKANAASKIKIDSYNPRPPIG